MSNEIINHKRYSHMSIIIKNVQKRKKQAKILISGATPDCSEPIPDFTGVRDSVIILVAIKESIL